MNGPLAIRSHAGGAGAQAAPAIRTLGRQDPLHREVLGARPGRARLHRSRAVHQPRLDRVDAGLPVRRGHSPVRCHRRAGVPRNRPRSNRRAHGAAPHPHRRSRPRLQQCQHLRQPAPPDGRGAHPREPLGAPLLRAGVEMLRRRAGRPLVADRRWRRLHLLFQRAALAVRRYHPHAARRWRSATCWATR